MSESSFQYKIISAAEGNFFLALEDVVELRRLHDAATNSAPGRPKPELEVLKRSAVILVVTAWESYIEDALSSAAIKRIDNAKTPTDTGKAFLATAQRWLAENPKSPEIAMWTGDNWRTLVKARLKAEIETLNTPNSENIAKLSSRYLGIDVTKKWFWPSTSVAMATKKLDELIKLRGTLVHRGKRFSLSTAASVTRPQMANGIELIKRLMSTTEAAIKAS